MFEVEQEPSPSSYLIHNDDKEQRPRSAASGPPAPAATTPPSVTVARRPSILEHAFGRQMVRGDGEWRGESDAVRSSFLVVAKELKRQDVRLRALEGAHSSPCRQCRQSKPTRHDGVNSVRWEAGLQEQVALLGDELRLLTQLLSASDSRALEATTLSESTRQQWQQLTDERYGRCE